MRPSQPGPALHTPHIPVLSWGSGVQCDGQDDRTRLRSYKAQSHPRMVGLGVQPKCVGTGHVLGVGFLERYRGALCRFRKKENPQWCPEAGPGVGGTTLGPVHPEGACRARGEMAHVVPSSEWALLPRGLSQDRRPHSCAHRTFQKPRAAAVSVPAPLHGCPPASPALGPCARCVEEVPAAWGWPGHPQFCLAGFPDEQEPGTYGQPLSEMRRGGERPGASISPMGAGPTRCSVSQEQAACRLLVHELRGAHRAVQRPAVLSGAQRSGWQQQAELRAIWAAVQASPPLLQLPVLASLCQPGTSGCAAQPTQGAAQN